MTNHIHLIARSKTGKLSDTIRDIKKFTSKKILREIHDNPQESHKEWLEIIFRYYAKYNKRCEDYQFWTHENHAVELNTDDKLNSRLHYIHYNPVKAGIVADPKDYLYSSAVNYAHKPALIEIDMI